MHVDFKVTTWERLTLDTDTLSPNDIAEIKRKIKDGIIRTSCDLIEEVGSSQECETLYEVEEQMTVISNEGEATIEFFEHSSEVEPTLTNKESPLV